MVKVLFASATNNTSLMKQKLQESGAEIHQIPTFKREEYTLTSEQINEIFNVDRLVFCSAESVEILMRSCSKHQKDIRSLQAKLQYMNVATKEKLMQYGLLSKQAEFSSDTTVYLGRNINRIGFIQEKIGVGSYMMTHEYTIDHRFDEIHSRMLSEFSWDSIVFEGRASIDTFLAEIKRLNFINILTLPFSYIDIPTLHYANKVGFHNIDHPLQDIIMKKDMVAQ